MAARTFPFGMCGDTSEEGTRPLDLMVRMGVPSNAPSWSISPRDGAGRQPGHQLNKAGVPPTPQKEALRPRHGPRAAEEAVGRAERGQWVAHSRQGPACRRPRSSAILRQGEASRGGEEMAGSLGSGVSDCGPATCPLRRVPE